MPERAPLPARASQLAALGKAEAYARQSLNPRTLKAYRADWDHFQEWCCLEGFGALPAAPETVAAYLASMALTHGRSSLRRRLTAIGQAHRLAEQDFTPGHPAIRHTLRGILRQHGAPRRKAAALGTAEVRKLVATCGSDLAGVRDRALLLVGFAAALRCSELVAIHREHLTFRPDGLHLLIPRAKGDQENEGAEIGIPRGAKAETCPVRAMQAWLRLSDCQYGPVFRKVTMWGTVEPPALHPNAVGYILRKRAAEAGVAASGLERLSSHGLRAGFVTEAYKAGARDEEIMAHTRHCDLKTMRSYVRRAKLVNQSPAKLVGL